MTPNSPKLQHSAAPAGTPNKGKIAVGLTASTALALVMAVATLKTDEGKRNVGYLDIAKVPTECFGHTGPDVRVGRVSSDARCEALLTDDAKVHMAGVLRCTPALAERPYQLAAATRITFNIGVNAYCGSTMAKRFNAGQLRAACDAFLPWNKARPKGPGTPLVVIPGIAARRQHERAMCLTGLA